MKGLAHYASKKKVPGLRYIDEECDKCGRPLTQAQHDYSLKIYGKKLCYFCQRK